MIKILMLLENNLYTDERVQKTCMSLSDLGLEIHIVYPKQNENPEVFEYKNVYQYPQVINKSIFKKLLATCLIQPFYFWLWKYWLNGIFKKPELFKAIYIHDLPLTKLGYDFKKKYGCLLICDQHEYYSEWIYHNKHMQTLVGKLVSHWSDWKIFEKKYLSKADLVISVLEPLCNLYVKNIPELKNRIVHLPNAPLRSIYEKPKPEQSILEKYISKKFTRSIYIGATLDHLRGLDLVIDAVPIIVKKIPDFRLMILGNKHPSYDILSHIKRNQVENYVELAGTVPITKIPQYLSCSVIGLNLHNITAGREIHETIFTKVYQYIAAHNALITTELRSMAELVKKHNIGEVTKNSPEDVASHIINMLSNFEILNTYMQNTKKIKNVFWEDLSKPWEIKIKQMLE